MDIFKKSIDNQIAYNQGLNMFKNGISNSLRFIPETIEAIEAIEQIDADAENLLIDYVTNKVLLELCRVNQYYNFNSLAKSELRELYVDLFQKIKCKNVSIEKVSNAHYDKLTQWLQRTNAFADKVYSTQEEKIDAVACSEYSSDLQIDILQLNQSKINEPLLDIGCGKQGDLVKSLRDNGFDAFGIDRFAENSTYLFIADWLEFDYGIEKWGTITSNLGFSNHFRHHHYRADGDFLAYAKKYMDILNALKVGGSFHYAPDLPFIESYLDENKYHITRNVIGTLDFKSVVVSRLR